MIEAGAGVDRRTAVGSARVGSGPRMDDRLGLNLTRG